MTRLLKAPAGFTGCELLSVHLVTERSVDVVIPQVITTTVGTLTLGRSWTPTQT